MRYNRAVLRQKRRSRSSAVSWGVTDQRQPSVSAIRRGRSRMAAVIARPTKSLVLFSQMVGRATRGEKAGGNKRAEVATVVDTRLPGFCNVADAFDNWEDVW